MISVTEFGSLVDRKLATHAADHQPWPGGIWPLEDLSDDEYREAVALLFESRRTQRRPPAHRLDLMLALLEYLGEIDASPAAERIALQRCGEHRRTSETWRREIAAGGSSAAWLALAAQHEAAGRQLEASAQLAIACWLDPDAEPAAAELVSRRDPALVPHRMREQPLPGFRNHDPAQRHFLIWNMRRGCRIDVPSMIAYACDENFWVRGTAYRSLGLQPYLAVVPVLLDGLLDPHPHARERAAESLGWTCAPQAVQPLRDLAEYDESPHVRLAAELAAQRIVAYWTYYGEWTAILRDRRRAHAVARDAASRGLGRAALAHVGRPGLPPDDPSVAAEHRALLADLRCFAVTEPPREPATHPVTRGHVARKVEQAILAADPLCELDPMLALYAVSKQRRNPERAIAVVDAPGALGWNARRALRALRLPRTASPGVLAALVACPV